MPEEIIALIDKPHLLIAVLAVGAFCTMATEHVATRWRRKSWWQLRNRRSTKGRGARPFVGARITSLDTAHSGQLDASAQLRIVMNADFAVQPLLNIGERRVFRELDRLVLACNPDWQVMAQVSLGEILRSRNADAYRSINAKRVDLLLVDGESLPRHAIEYQGAGHYQGTAAARDAIKKEALRRAGIGYHEVIAGHTTPQDLRRLVEKLVSAAGARG